MTKPILIIGAGPVGLTTALACQHYGLPVQVFEEDDRLSTDTKAGTILTRTIEAFRRFGVAAPVLSQALRIDEIGDIERATNRSRSPVFTEVLRDETRYPFIINLPQHHLEPILQTELERRAPGALQLEHRLVSFRTDADGVVARFATPRGEVEVEGSYLLACDGGRSTVRSHLGIAVEGHSLDTRMLLVDLKLDLDVANPRDYPYLAYFSDPQEWMILVRQPHCWRFLFPINPGQEEPSHDELREKVLHFIGEVDSIEILNTVLYRVHHRIATEWSGRRVFLMGDAAHLITPMWALGLNTGILDAMALPWRLAWVLRGWADESVLDGYEREQKPVAAHGSGEMAEAARKYMEGRVSETTAMAGGAWANALTRTMLGVSLDVEGTGQWSMVTTAQRPLRPGDRIPDYPLHDGHGRPCRVHDLVDGGFVALYFTDVRRRPSIPRDGEDRLKHFVVSRWDAPLDGGLRNQALLDVGEGFFRRLGIANDTLVLLRPDDHVAAIVPIGSVSPAELYKRVTGRVP